MQTFLPYPNFESSASVLDKKRCWKQVIEAKQIYQALTDINSPSHRFINHPAVQMWEGYEEFLARYFNVFLAWSKFTHKIRTNMSPLPITKDAVKAPWWFGNNGFHRSHRARLLEKDYDFYKHKFPEDKLYNNGKYWWPDNETKTFRII